MRLLPTTLQGRIFALFLTLTASIQLGGILVSSTLGRAIVETALHEDIDIAKQVFQRLFTQNATFLNQGARILAADYGFREAIASDDQATIVSALDNHGARINADLMLFVSRDGKIYSSSTGRSMAQRLSAPDWLAIDQDQNALSVQVIRAAGLLYQLIAVPVYAPLPIGKVIAGFLVDSRLAAEISAITHTDISFASLAHSGNWQLHASTLPRADYPSVQNLLGRQGLARGELTAFDSPSGQALARSLALPSPADQPIGVVLQKSYDAALVPFLTLRDRLLLLGLSGVVLSGLASLLIARGMTQPLRALVASAGTIAKGDYARSEPIHGTSEVTRLAQAIDEMREAIASREKRILELATREARIIDMAYRDPLTGLPNRAMFTDRLNQALSTLARIKKPFTLMLIDLDRFKHINDTFGHHAGDLVLKTSADRLRGSLRHGTDIVARLGGDEFAVLLTATPLEESQGIARALLAALAQPMVIEERLFELQGSLGICGAPHHASDAASLMRCADAAMYRAKRERLGIAVYDLRHDQRAQSSTAMLATLRHALENQEFALRYRPRIAPAQPNKLMVEASIVWIHPELGTLEEVDFMPSAEQTGFVRHITLWMIEAALSQAVTWSRAGHEVAVTLRLTGRDLNNKELPEHITRLLARYPRPPYSVCLEIPEQAISADPEQTPALLDNLMRAGCALAVGDYGTGSTSLLYLKRLPIDEIRMAPALSRKMDNDPVDAAIVRATLELAHHLGLHVIADGVDSDSVYQKLVVIDCDRLQGDAIAPALAGDAYSDWVAHHIASLVT